LYRFPAALDRRRGNRLRGLGGFGETTVHPVGRIHISTSKNWKKRASVLRSIGALPRHYRISELGESEKRHIRRTERKFKNDSTLAPILKNPQKFITGKIKGTDAKKLRRQGYAVIRTGGGTKFIAERQHSNQIRFDTKTKSIVRTFPNRTSRSYPLDDNPATLRRIESFFQSKAKSEYLTLRIGGKAPFNISIDSLTEFNRYVNRLESEWEKRGKHSPRPYLQIVEVRNNERDKTESDATYKKPRKSRAKPKKQAHKNRGR
jgi:hypothetical protein